MCREGMKASEPARFRNSDAQKLRIRSDRASELARYSDSDAQKLRIRSGRASKPARFRNSDVRKLRIWSDRASEPARFRNSDAQKLRIQPKKHRNRRDLEIPMPGSCAKSSKEAGITRRGCRPVKSQKAFYYCDSPLRY